MSALLQIGLSNAVICGIMAALLLLLARLLRRPALTHALSVLILLKLLTPPVFSVPIIRNSTAASKQSQQTTTAEAAPSLSDSTSIMVPADAANVDAAAPADATIESIPRQAPVVPVVPPPSHALLAEIWEYAGFHWLSWLIASWITSAVLLGAVTIARIIRLDLAVRRATTPGPDISQDVELLSSRLGVRRIPRVRFIAGAAAPMLLAPLRRPELVIPIDLWDRLDGLQRQTILLHELAHLYRGDHLVRYLELLATCVYWWHPAMWFTRFTLREAEEQCCDAWVVWAMPDSTRAYMTTLLDAIDFMSQRARPRLLATPVLASGMGQFHNLQRRLTMVREGNVKRRLGRRGLAAVVLLSAITLPLGAELARGNDNAARQPNPSAMPRPDIATDASATDPRELANEPPKGLAADQCDPDNNQPALAEDEVARLAAELDAARKNVDRLRRQLDFAKSKLKSRRSATPRIAGVGALASAGPDQPTAPASAAPRADNRRTTSARLGHIIFRYQDDGPDGKVLAFDGPSKKLLWTLDVPLNADSVIQCYDNETLLIKSADGYTRLVTAEEGKVTRAWAPGVAAPTAAASEAVNPFGISTASPNAAQTPSPDRARAPSRSWQDQERRLERMEESIRSLTDAVNRLTRAQSEQQNPAAPRRQ